MPDTETREVQIAIAGAGLSGLGMAIALRRDGIEDFVVLERADDLGGTWRDNSYPGCACDIASVLYSYSDEQNPAWTRAFAHQPEIQAYIHGVARRHDVARHMRYGHEVLEAGWDEDAERWQIRTREGDFTAEILISAVGALADPSIPDLPGLDDLRGHRVSLRALGARTRSGRSPRRGCRHRRLGDPVRARDPAPGGPP